MLLCLQLEKFGVFQHPSGFCSVSAAGSSPVGRGCKARLLTVPGWSQSPLGAPACTRTEGACLQPTASHSLSWEDRSSSDLCQCCGMQAAYNGFMDLHRHMLTLLGKSDSTAPMLVKMLEQNSFPCHLPLLLSKGGFSALQHQ